MTTVLLKASPEALPLKCGGFGIWPLIAAVPCAVRRRRTPHGFITKAISSTSIFTE